MQPTMHACAWIHQAQDRSWRPYVLRTPDAAMRTSPPHVYYPWQVFQRWRLQSPEGPLHQGSATPRCPEHQVFPRPFATVSQARWRNGNNFHGCTTDWNVSREDLGLLLLLSLQDLLQAWTLVSAQEGARQIQQGPTNTPPGGVIDRMRKGSIVGSVGPIHGPGRRRSHASAGQPDRPEGED
jgi:hypothetical protein